MKKLLLITMMSFGLLGYAQITQIGYESLTIGEDTYQMVDNGVSPFITLEFSDVAPLSGRENPRFRYQGSVASGRGFRITLDYMYPSLPGQWFETITHENSINHIFESPATYTRLNGRMNIINAESEAAIVLLTATF